MGRVKKIRQSVEELIGKAGKTCIVLMGDTPCIDDLVLGRIDRPDRVARTAVRDQLSGSFDL